MVVILMLNLVLRSSRSISSSVLRSRGFFVFTVGLALASSGMQTSRGEGPAPNLVMILCDDLGYGDVGINGAPDIETPNVDALARSGLTLSRMRSNCTVCSPTRAAILTGLYPDRAGVPGVIRTTPSNSWGYLRTDVPTIADRLGDVGYHTAIVGKWHLGLASPNRPTDRGFDHFHGFLGDMMDDYYHHRRQGQHYMRLGIETVNPEGHATEIFTRWAVDYLKSRAENSETPFYLYLAYNAPHFPIHPPPDWLEATKKKHPNAPEKRQANIAFVEHLDHEIGKVLRALDELGLAENTTVVLTSDNGGSLPHAQRNLPFRDGKQSHYDGGLRVPCFVRIPGVTQPGSVNDTAAMTFDLSGTFLDLAGRGSLAGFGLRQPVASDSRRRNASKAGSLLCASRGECSLCGAGLPCVDSRRMETDAQRSVFAVGIVQLERGSDGADRFGGQAAQTRCSHETRDGGADPSGGARSMAGAGSEVRIPLNDRLSSFFEIFSFIACAHRPSFLTRVHAPWNKHAPPPFSRHRCHLNRFRLEVDRPPWTCRKPTCRTGNCLTRGSEIGTRQPSLCLSTATAQSFSVCASDGVDIAAMRKTLFKTRS